MTVVGQSKSPSTFGFKFMAHINIWFQIHGAHEAPNLRHMNGQKRSMWTQMDSYAQKLIKTDKKKQKNKQTHTKRTETNSKIPKTKTKLYFFKNLNIKKCKYCFKTLNLGVHGFIPCGPEEGHINVQKRTDMDRN